MLMPMGRVAVTLLRVDEAQLRLTCAHASEKDVRPLVPFDAQERARAL
jgi:hypothetical protein